MSLTTVGRYLAFTLMLISISAEAVPIRWEMQAQFEFQEDDYLTGGFTYDPATDTYYDITLKTFHQIIYPGHVTLDYANALVEYIPNPPGDIYRFTKTVHTDGITEEYLLDFFDLRPWEPRSFTFDVIEVYKTDRPDDPIGGLYVFNSLDFPDGTGGYAVGVPIPEPETYVLMMAGLGVLGFFGKRRTKGLGD